MNALTCPKQTTKAWLDHAIRAACDGIAPNWPLDRLIAVNPYWQHTHSPFAEVAANLAQLAGSPMTLPLSYYRTRWQNGQIQPEHLARAVAEQGGDITLAAMLATLQQEDQAPLAPPLLCDALDQQRDLQHQPSWRHTITQQIGQFCAAYFDQAQADWRPDQNQNLYASWRHGLSQDHSVALLMKAPALPGKAAQLASCAEAQIESALQQLGLVPEDWAAYLQAVMLRVSGWAAWCAYRRWQAKLVGSDENSLVDLLAIRLSWETLLDDGARQRGAVWQQWQQAWRRHLDSPHPRSLQRLAIWQRAHELSYQASLVRQLLDRPADAAPLPPPKVQAVFCIDVRSELLRRHLEAQSSTIQTLGFAGFFGLPIRYTPLGTEASRPQLPGLLAPSLAISDTTGCRHTDAAVSRRRQGALQTLFGWRPWQTMPASGFTLVETLGLGYASKLIKRSLPATDSAPAENRLGLTGHTPLRPSLKTALGADLAAQTAIAEQVLTGMGLKAGLAPLVLLVGHGSQNRNNPQRAGLDCGACCGQTGEVNARALAALLNDDEVRAALAERQILVPASTWFVAALHNTTTDEVTLFDTDLLPEGHRGQVEEVTGQLAAAGLAARRERAPRLGLAALCDQPAKLTRTIKQRANDWAQTRPEWGLANNAAFIIAPRARTRGLNLAGRSFLHEYDPRQDEDGRWLTQIMTAPMIVAHWINLQYYASTVDNHRYGSGNKTLHNVVGGHLGVFEGNGGDLRIGLAWQSVHDGHDWQHEPLRLTVVIDAPRAILSRIIQQHEKVRQLLDNQWLYLLRLDDGGVETYHQGQWQPWQANDPRYAS
ncbi:DUF2309 domain-containing protein [Pseudaeromonas paramecii]|uniref:Probable inorganic carbon transporter subunit DabA n=1 Tax=Pseudaeromonas paramecii TaxID=2138166 RepID=A0ABP8QK61_9GAMM